jgi:aldehyde dehydrogenase (NAD+)
MSQNVFSEIKRVFELQQAHQWEMRAANAEQRKAKLNKLKSVIQSHADEIVAAVSQDNRKPLFEVTRTEVNGVIAAIDENIDNLEEWMKPVEIVPTTNKKAKAKIIYEPKGVCLILGPWNFPFSLVISPLAAAIAAGNCCIVKLSDMSPATSRVAAKIIKEAFDEKEVALFEGEVDVATALLDLPFNHIFFTGSTHVGKIVMTAAAKHLASVTLELGGKSPTIIDEGVDLQKIAPGIGRGKLINGGQACIAPDYVFIRKEQQDEFVGHLQEFVKRNYIAEDGRFKKEDLAQIVNDRNFARIKRLFDDAVSKGARVAFGGIFEEVDRTIHPTVLTDVTPDMLIMQEEIFGPVLPILTYENIDDVIKYIRERDKPLALYIYSNNQNTIDKVLNNTSSGGVTVNDVIAHFREPQLPFGGINASGLGSYHGIFGFKAFSHERAVYIQAD